VSDSLLETFLRYGTSTERAAFTPDPPVVSGSAVKVLYEWRETNTGDVYVYDTSWHLISSGTATAITSLTSDVTATGPGAAAATIANNAVTTAKINNAAVTLAKIANAAASSKLVGSGASGSGAAYSELTVGSGLTMTGTTLSATGSGGTVTNTGTLTSAALIAGNGGVDVKVATAAANSKLIGSGASGSGAAYAELTLGTNLSMSGTTLNATGGGTPGGSDKDVQYNNAGAFGGIAPSTAGFVLTSNGGSSTPSFQAAAGGSGALILLEQHTASASASLNFTTSISSTYDTYRIYLLNVVAATNGVAGYFRVSTNGGSSYDSGANYSSVVQVIIASTAAYAGGTAQGQIILTNSTNVSSGANDGLSGWFEIYAPGAGIFPHVRFDLTFKASDGTRALMTGGGLYESTTPVDAFQFLMSSGNIASGIIRCYGVAK